MANKKVLFGFHNHRDVDNYNWIFEDSGFKVDDVNSLDGMLERMTQSQYDWYLMDVNLGVLAGHDFSPSQKVYDLVRKRVEIGEARFLALSYCSGIVKKAIDEGLPAMDKCELSLKWLKSQFKRISS